MPDEIKNRQSESYSAFTAVYIKETADNVARCLTSVYEQTVPPDDMIVVCDGPISDDLEVVLCNFKDRYDSLRIVRLEKNCGRPIAFQAGNDACRNDLIMKIGSDDCCRPYRAEMQLEAFSREPDLVACGGYMQSYRTFPGDSGLVRKVPLELSEIRTFARRRNPFNDATVMYRKAAFDSVHGYDRTLLRGQDYDLYARMIQAGYKLCNLPAVLTDAREDADAIRRRRSFVQVKCAAEVRWKLYQSGFSSFLDFLIPTVATAVMAFLPNQITEAIYERVLRDKS